MQEMENITMVVRKTKRMNQNWTCLAPTNCVVYLSIMEDVELIRADKIRKINCFAVSAVRFGPLFVVLIKTTPVKTKIEPNTWNTVIFSLKRIMPARKVKTTDITEVRDTMDKSTVFSTDKTRYHEMAIIMPFKASKKNMLTGTATPNGIHIKHKSIIVVEKITNTVVGEDFLSANFLLVLYNPMDMAYKKLNKILID